MEPVVKKPAGKKISLPVKITPLQGNGNFLLEPEITERPAMGWLPDYPDFRDYDPSHQEIKKLFRGTKLANGKLSLPVLVDLRPWCSPIENQGSLGSCTANAGAGLIEYFERRANGNYLDASRLFLYKATRNFMQVTGDSGAYLRNTMGAMVLFGVVPEKYWPYNIAGFDIEPPAFCYSFASNYKAIKYYRLDPAGTSRPNILNNVKTNLAAGFPSMFGFSVYHSFYQAQVTAKVPVPASSGDPWIGGHAVDAVGYDDTIRIKNSIAGSVETVGALLIRNSWGLWGPMGGYLWMPYDYILKGLASDFWTLNSSEYIQTGMFNI
jgi:C1A family cysteine protease